MWSIKSIRLWLSTMSDSELYKSALYWGDVYHSRLRPKRHDFRYRFMQWFIALDELPAINDVSRWFSTGGFAPLWFRQKDYLKGIEGGALSDKALNKMSELAGNRLSGEVHFLGNLRTFGLYFSPVNFYYLKQPEGYTHLLAEVSNTPWLERHYYLVYLRQEGTPTTDKAFHVSPFNPMQMTYRWKITEPTDSLFIQLSADTDKTDFIAGMKLSRKPLNRISVNRVLTSTPVMAIKIVAGIYWQALKLFVKRVPFYGHP